MDFTINRILSFKNTLEDGYAAKEKFFELVSTTYPNMVFDSMSNGEFVFTLTDDTFVPDGEVLQSLLIQADEYGKVSNAEWESRYSRTQALGRVIEEEIRAAGYTWNLIWGVTKIDSLDTMFGEGEWYLYHKADDGVLHIASIMDPNWRSVTFLLNRMMDTSGTYDNIYFAGLEVNPENKTLTAIMDS